MDKLPFDIIINKILPYTYQVQKKELLDDIINFCFAKKFLLNNDFNPNTVKHDLIYIVLSYSANQYIYYRNFNRKFIKFSVKNFTIFLGLMKPEERNCFF
jgi:hypothetical protein